MRLVHFGAGLYAVAMVYGYSVVANFVIFLHSPKTNSGLQAVSGGILNLTFALSVIAVFVAVCWMSQFLIP